MKIIFSQEIAEELKKIQEKDQKLAHKIEKKLLLFKENPKHPSLRLHKVTGEVDNRWSISITMSIRMIYLSEENGAYFIAVGKHEDVYRK